MVNLMKIQNKKLLNANDVATILCVSKSLVYHLMREKKITYVQIENAKRVRRADLDKYIEDHLCQ